MKSKLLLKLLRCKHKSDVKAILKQLPKCSVVLIHRRSTFQEDQVFLYRRIQKYSTHFDTPQEVEF